jgi:hypothetical protein
MEFPILSKELRVSLRGRETFFTVFFLYSLIAAVVSVAWGIMTDNQMFVFWRDGASRVLFYLFIGFGFFAFCFQAGLMAAKILVIEREKKSSSLIRIAPLRAWNLVFQKMATPMLMEWLFLRPSPSPFPHLPSWGCRSRRVLLSTDESRGLDEHGDSGGAEVFSLR